VAKQKGMVPWYVQLGLHVGLFAVAVSIALNLRLGLLGTMGAAFLAYLVEQVIVGALDRRRRRRRAQATLDVFD